MSKPKKFVYKNNLVNLSNSIIKHFTGLSFHETMGDIDDLLKGHEKVALLLFDGSGTSLIRKHLDKDSYIRSHYYKTIHSVYPPTTVAATTSLLSAKYPVETGWLGWCVYLQEYDCNIDYFSNKCHETGICYEPDTRNKLILKDICPYTDIFTIIRDNSDYKAIDLKCYPVYEEGFKDFNEMISQINSNLKSLDKGFLYAYNILPDKEIHTEGTSSNKITEIFKDIDQVVKEVTLANPDTLFLVLADHGLIDINYIDISEQEDIYNTLLRPISLEGRTTAFFVKKGKKALFKRLFNKYYGKDFYLLSPKQALKLHVFGEGKPNEHYYDFTGDFISISHSHYTFISRKSYIGKEPNNYKASHAGYSKEEDQIDISVFNR
ncbi:MAG: alkaline phosphatase family protein [Coprobacillus sp.]|nr:alkaline phosphatase family protein [Coprobacillus sp.]